MSVAGEVRVLQVLPFFHGYHGSMGRVAAFSSSISKIQRLKDCIRLFGMPYCDLSSHNGTIDISQSIPEFAALRTPKDATRLQFDKDGSYNQEKTIEVKKEAAKAVASADANAGAAEAEAAPAAASS